jgi:hypothetical protein
MPWELALADSLVFNLLLSALLLPVWYAIAYYHSDKNIVLNTIINHSTILVIVLLIWMHLGNWILLGFNYRPLPHIPAKSPSMAICQRYAFLPDGGACVLFVAQLRKLAQTRTNAK